jgi:hypothetical protein
MSLPLKKNSEMATTAIVKSSAKVASELASGLKKIPEVVKAYYSLDGDLFSSWILVDLYELPVLRAIFELQQYIMEHNPEFEFDFNVLAPLEASGPDPFFTDAEVVYSRVA